MKNALVPFEKNTWHQVRIDITGNGIEVYYDDNKTLSTQDNRLKTGDIFFSIAPNTTAQFDDIDVWSQP